MGLDRLGKVANLISRGDVYWVNLDPTLGAEIQKTRPCVIVSNDIANRFSPLVTVLPITSQKLDQIYPHEVPIENLHGLKSSKIKVNQVRTIDKKRLGKRIGALSELTLKRVNWSLANHLGLIEE